MHFLLRRSFKAMSLLLVVTIALYHLGSSRYRKIERVSYVNIFAKNNNAYIIVSTRQTMIRSRNPIVRSLAMMWPDSDEISTSRMHVIETNGFSVKMTLAPDNFDHHMMPEGDILYAQGRHGDDGSLFCWRNGIATPVPAMEAAMIRGRMLQQTAAQCDSQGWTYFSSLHSSEDGGLDLYDPGVRGSRDRPVIVHLGPKAVRLQFACIPPSKPTAPPPDQSMLISIDSNSEIIFNQLFPYKQISSGLTRQDWEAFDRARSMKD